MHAAEAELLQRLAVLDEQEGSDEHDGARSRWYEDVNTFLQSNHANTHWFCRCGAV
jgi:hypothetical protein